MLALRILHGTEARGFMGRVLAVVSRPYPHLHLSYPERIEAAVVRNAERVDTRVLTLVRNATQGEQKWHPGVIRDVSNTGALLHTVNPLGRMGDELDLRFNLDVCGRQEVLDLKAVLRNQANALAAEIDPEYQTRIKTGIEWRVANRYQEVLLSNYLLTAKGAGEPAQPTRPGDRG